MINIPKLTESNKGQKVMYTESGTGHEEVGVLKSWNDSTIYVVFKCGGQWDNYQNYTGEGCDPGQCRFIDPAARRDNCAKHEYVQVGCSTIKTCKLCNYSIEV